MRDFLKYQKELLEKIKGATYDILETNGLENIMLYFALLIEDYEILIQNYLLKKNPKKAFHILKKYCREIEKKGEQADQEEKVKQLSKNHSFHVVFMLQGRDGHCGVGSGAFSGVGVHRWSGHASSALRDFDPGRPASIESVSKGLWQAFSPGSGH